MLFSLFLVLSTLASLCLSQTLTAPVITNVRQVNSQYAVIEFSSTYVCALTDMCWFTVFRDADFAIDMTFDSGAGSYYFAAYFGEGGLTYSTHTFYAVHSSLMLGADSPRSNLFTVTFTPPPPVQPPSDIVGDPQFMGLKGQVYQVHGAPEEVFNIITDRDLQYNSKFVYLDSGECPTLANTQQAIDTACFTHPGTYLGTLGLETSKGDRIFIQAGAAPFGYAKVELNGQRVPMNELLPLSPSGFIVRNNSHVVTMQAGNFRLEFTNSDMFVNQVVEMLDTTRTTSHGLLGQSWSTKVHNPKASIPWIEGTVWDYAVEDRKVFSNKFTFNKFVSDPESEAKAAKAQALKSQPTSIHDLKQQAKNRLFKTKQ